LSSVFCNSLESCCFLEFRGIVAVLDRERQSG
jgi:hypothetical protein